MAVVVKTLGLVVVPGGMMETVVKFVEEALKSDLAELVTSKLFGAGSKVKGLFKVFKDLDITEHLVAAEAFCEEHGANHVADLKRLFAAGLTYANQLATVLNLKRIKAIRLNEVITALPDRE